MYAAAVYLQRLVQSYITGSPENVVGKYVPTGAAHSTSSSSADSASHAPRRFIVAYDAQELLAHLPSSMDGTGPYSANADKERRVMRFLADTILRHLQHHAAVVGGANADAAGRRANFIVWVVLVVYGVLAKEAEEAHERAEHDALLQPLAGEGGAGVWTASFRRRRQRLWDFWQTSIASCGAESTASSALLRDADFLSRARDVFSGPHGEEADPLAVDKDSISSFMQEVIGPVLARARQLPLRCHDASPPPSTAPAAATVEEAPCEAVHRTTPLPPLRSLNETQLGLVVEHLRCQFPFDPFAPGWSALHAVAATAACHTAPLLQRTREYAAAWEAYVTSLFPVTPDHLHLALRQPSSASSSASLSSLPRRVQRALRSMSNALQHVLDLAAGAVQVAPSAINPEDDVESAQTSGVCGAWLTSDVTPPAASGHSRAGRRVRYHRRHTQRATVVFPGLAIAATQFVSVAGGGNTGPCSSVPTPEKTTAAGTFLVSPVQALSMLVLPDVAESVGTVAGCRRVHVDCDDVYDVADSVLRPVTRLLLFRALPSRSIRDDASAPPLTLAAVADVVRRVHTGLVVLLVQAHVEKEVQQLMEEWGSPTRTVLLVSSIGDWGMTQLALRFRVHPNTLFTRPSSLRAVDDRHLRNAAAGGGTGRSCDVAYPGVLVYALDEVDVTSGSAVTLAERRRRLVVVVGECSRNGAQNAVLKEAVPTDTMASTTTTAPPVLPVTTPNSMFAPLEGEDTDDDETTTATTSSGHDTDSDTCGSDSSSSFVTSEDENSDATSNNDTEERQVQLSEEAAEEVADRARSVRKRMKPVRKPSSRLIPLLPVVTCAVLLGGTTAALQRESRHALVLIQRYLLHRWLLPAPVDGVVASEDSSAALDLAVLHALDGWAAEEETASSRIQRNSSTTTAPATTTTPGTPSSGNATDVGLRTCINGSKESDHCNGGGYSVTSLFRRRVCGALREAVWTYCLLGVQHRDGLRVERAWELLQEQLQQCRTVRPSMVSDHSGSAAPVAAVARWETFLDVHNAYWTIAHCLDDLCHTALLYTHDGDADDRFVTNEDNGTVYFLPLIE